MYRIGLFSQITKTTIKTLRYYDEVGLLHPCHVDEENGYRYYQSEQLVRLHQIIALKQMGLSIEEIFHIINKENGKKILKDKQTQIIREIQALKDQHSRISHYLTEKENQTMNYQAVIQEVPTCIVYSKRLIVKNYDDYFRDCSKFCVNIKSALNYKRMT